MEKIPQVKDFFERTDQYLKSNPIIELRKNIVRELVGECQNMNIIDIGSGNGELTKEYVSNNKVTFLDISENMLSIARRNVKQEYLNNAVFLNSDFLHYISDYKFDIAICFGVVAHVENVLTLIKKLKEVTTNNAIIILQYTDASKFLSRFNQLRYELFASRKFDYNINLTTSSEMDIILKQEGFTITNKLQYIPVSPLLSAFSYKIKLKLLMASYRIKLFSFLSPEVVLCLSKTP